MSLVWESSALKGSSIAPKIWQIRSIPQLLDAPYAVAVGIGIMRRGFSP